MAISQSIKRTNAGNLMESEVPLSTHLPYSALLDQHTLATDNDVLMQTFKVQGLPHETADTTALLAKRDALNQFLRGAADSRFAIYTHWIRRKQNTLLKGEFPPGFATDLDRAWQAKFRDKEMLVNDLYITGLRKGGTGAAQRLVHLAYQLLQRIDERERRRHRQACHAQLNTFMQQLEQSMKDYGLRKLGTVEDENYGKCSELLELYNYLLYHQHRIIPLPRQSVANALAWKRISFKGSKIHIPNGGHDYHVAMVSIREYGEYTYIGLLAQLLRAPFEFTLTQSYSFMDSPVAQERMKIRSRQYDKSQDDAQALADGITEAMNDLAGQKVCYGDHHLTIALFEHSLENARERAAGLVGYLGSLGIQGIVEDFGAEPAFWAQLPGNQSYIARGEAISSQSFAEFSGFYNLPTGRPQAHWGEGLTVIESTGGGPYFLNLHDGDLGNTVITGISGSGKTTATNFLFTQSLKYGGQRFLFDKDRGSEIFIRAVGGEYIDFQPGKPTGLNPLLMEDTVENKTFLYHWWKMLLGTDDEDGVISNLIERGYSLDPEKRTLGNLAPFLGARKGSKLRTALDKWIAGGVYSWVFNNSNDTLSLGHSVLGFEMGKVLDVPEIRTPVVAYLIHRIRQQLTGQPVIIGFEEGWRLLDDNYFKPILQDFELTIRKLNGLVVFLIQEPNLALKTDVGRLILTQSPTKIFFPDPKAKHEVYVDQLGLSERQFQLIRDTPKEEHSFLFLQDRDAVVAKLDMAGMDDELAVLSGRERNIRRLDDIRETVGDAPENWLPIFLEEVRNDD